MTGYVTCIFGFFVAGCFLLPRYSNSLNSARREESPPPPFVLGHYHDPQSHYPTWHRIRPPPPRRPVDIMTDVINDLGTRVLQQYVDKGNVAFSPAGVGFILAALYEGSAGHSRQQIVDCLGLPNDRNLIRIGMRDIHRRLRVRMTRARGNYDAILPNGQDDTEYIREQREKKMGKFLAGMVERGLKFMQANDRGEERSKFQDENGCSELTMQALRGYNEGKVQNVNYYDSVRNNGLKIQDEIGGSSGLAVHSGRGYDGFRIEGGNGRFTEMMKRFGRFLWTYLNPDGFLGGLNLNRENTSLRADYENILRFYGFDLTIDLSNFTANTTPNFGLKSSMTTTVTTAQSTTLAPGMMGTTVPPTTNGMAAGSTMAAGGSTTPAPPDSTTIDTSVVLVTTQSTMTTITSGAQTATSTVASTTTGGGTTQPPAANVQAASTMVTTAPPSTTPTATTIRQPTTTMSTMTTMNPNAALISTTLPRLQATTPINRAFLTAGVTTEVPTTTMPSTTMPTTTILNSADTTTPIDDIATVAAPTIIPSLLRRRRGRRRRRSNEGYFSNYPDEGLWMQDLDIWADQPTAPTNVRDATELQFLVNGCEVANVPAATYTAVLPFAYFPSLKAVGLEFPLDNPRYNVLLLLPTERVDTGRLSRELGSQSLRHLRRQLQPTWVRATIPSFMLRGFVTLTPYLQRLGITDVFEPRLADLSPMTPDLGVYARDVQQSIAVNIRNYMKADGTGGSGNVGNMNGNNINMNNVNMNANPANGAQSNNPIQQEPPLLLPPRRDSYRFLRPANGLLDRVGLVSFTAEHPFLYFIIDNETSASLIAGRIDDPLNSRIL